MVFQRLALADRKSALEEASLVAAQKLAGLLALQGVGGDLFGVRDEAPRHKSLADLLQAEHRERVAMRTRDDGVNHRLVDRGRLSGSRGGPIRLVHRPIFLPPATLL